MSGVRSFTLWYLRDDGAIVAGATKHKEDQATVEMKRCLDLFHLTLMGVAVIIGGGIFVLTGRQARDVAGPSVMISYIVAGVVALIAALCYAEFSSEVTYTGGAFVYCAKIYGRAIGWFVAVNLLLEYVLAAATVAKGFTNYFASLFDIDLDSIQFCVSKCDSSSAYLKLDPVALALIVLLTIALCLGVKETFIANAITATITLITVVICIVGGATKIDNDNFTPFVPFGVKGIFQAASSVFFAYIGFDMVCTAAEEAKNPKRDIPLATILSIAICTACYVAMSTVISGMLPYQLIDKSAPFSNAFKAVGYKWGKTVVAIGSLVGVGDTVFVCLFSMSRLLVILGRTELVPEILTWVNRRFRTPILATCTTCLVAGLLAFMVPLDVLADLVSMGTLVAFAMVCIGVVFRSRYSHDGPTPLWKVLLPSVIVFMSSLACGLTYYYEDGSGDAWPYYLAFGGVWLLATLSFYLLPVVFTPSCYKTPWNPVVPCFGVATEMFLIATLGPPTWKAWAYAMIAALVIYVVNGVYVYMSWWSKRPVDVEDPDNALNGHQKVRAEKKIMMDAPEDDVKK